MADINVSQPPHANAADLDSAAAGDAAPRSQIDLIELLFFAYRNFVSDPDKVLQGYGFGRAHHRVLHFVNRHPGMRVTDLLDILRITKQSLGRVLRELVEGGFVDSRAGSSDRRQRLLHLTPKGAALARDFVAIQSQRIEKALAACSPGAREDVRRFLVAMIDAEDQAAVEKLIVRADLAAVSGGTRAGKAPARPR
ncbi:MarR family winged helix-turn-helix transcriptional regulator [Ancylobacter defluvii]|uniref:Transcriptional regulator n=1 Tax=Ancylobacter defluvii TaxID=1282440 RepID=A0A9W6NDH6_9HYPH|nr:MarR family transcriptional regulator [Ancylobacter defluvii]MBS7588169.1 MarR family transcriptional regulator [Ancylobacter defluvii]GLK86561.1 transcriptional regulator [Ancylobacter defluvii]